MRERYQAIVEALRVEQSTKPFGGSLVDVAPGHREDCEERATRARDAFAPPWDVTRGSRWIQGSSGNSRNASLGRKIG
jgi:hypothetical protein